MALRRRQIRYRLEHPEYLLDREGYWVECHWVVLLWEWFEYIVEDVRSGHWTQDVDAPFPPRVVKYLGRRL